jgi:hypothetical protein
VHGGQAGARSAHHAGVAVDAVDAPVGALAEHLRQDEFLDPLTTARERSEREGVQRHGPERRCGHGPATECVRTSTTPSAQRIPTAVLCTRDDACKGESGSVSLSCMNRPNVVLGGTEQRRGESTRTAARAPAVIYRLCGILDLEHLAIWAVRRAAQIVARADGRHGCKLRESGGGSWPWAA